MRLCAISPGACAAVSCRLCLPFVSKGESEHGLELKLAEEHVGQELKAGVLMNQARGSAKVQRLSTGETRDFFFAFFSFAWVSLCAPCFFFAYGVSL